MKKGLCLIAAMVIGLAFFAIDAYSNCKGKPKNGQVHIYLEKDEQKLSQTVVSTHSKSCPDCSGTIVGYKYKVKYKKKTLS